MSALKKILVGVDALEANPLESAPLSAPIEAAVKAALWLAETGGAEETFFSALKLPVHDHFAMPGDRERFASQAEATAGRVLKELVDRAAQRGVAASSRVAYGQAWTEIIREAIRGNYDLVIVGARQHGAVERFLFGSTAIKLLHNCPCPVWLARPQPQPQPSPANILVASDFSSASDQALELAIDLATRDGTKVHLLHVAEFPLAQFWDAGLLEARNEEIYHEKVRAEARERLERQLERALAGRTGIDVELHVTEGVGAADSAILGFVERNKIDLLIMGTMARSGIPGVFIGNTAERLAMQVRCSLLAVKPAGFVSAVSLEEETLAQPAAYM